jgi:hypothetical protein
MKDKPKRKYTKKERTFIVSINIDDMMYPEIGTVEIVATSAKEALKWVQDNLRLMIEE